MISNPVVVDVRNKCTFLKGNISNLADRTALISLSHETRTDDKRLFFKRFGSLKIQPSNPATVVCMWTHISIDPCTCTAHRPPPPEYVLKSRLNGQSITPLKSCSVLCARSQVHVSARICVADVLTAPSRTLQRRSKKLQL